MTDLTCPIPGCGFQTEDVDIIGAAAILNIHSHVHTASTAPRGNAAPAAARLPKLENPKVRLNSTTQDWNAFIR